jgi:hypothetical protein
MTEKRACKGTTKTGNACKAKPLKDSDYCLAHSDAQTRESTGFIAANGKGGRKPRPREVDVIRERIEEKVGAISDGLWEATKAEKAVVVGNGPTAYVEYVPDWPTRITAYRELLDRGYGRPTQISEVTVVTEDQLVAEIERMESELASNDPDSSGPRDAPPVQGAQGKA